MAKKWDVKFLLILLRKGRIIWLHCVYALNESEQPGIYLRMCLQVRSSGVNITCTPVASSAVSFPKVDLTVTLSVFLVLYM